MKITACHWIRLFALIFISFIVLPVWGATIMWINTSGGNWNVAGNWNSNQVPGAADIALITAPGTYVVAVNDTESVASLTIGGSSGMVTLQVDGGGVLNDSGGTLAATGSMMVAGGGSLNVTSGFNLAGPLTNVGTINMTNATLTINNNNTTTSGGIVNQGQINFYGASGDHISVVGYGYEYLVNQGTVNVLSGTGLSSITPYVGVLQGIYNAAMGTTLQFDGGPAANPVTVGTPPQLNGPGQYQFTSGYLLLTENVIPNLPLTASGSVLELGPAFQQSGAITNLTLGGITLAAGSYQVNGTLTVTNNSTINGAISVNSGAALDDSGGMTLAATGSLTIQGGGSLNVTSGFNLAGPLTNVGTINMTNATLTINNNNTTTSGGIVNQGQINFYGASGDHISVVGYGYEYLVNQGTVNVLSGTGLSSITPYVGVLQGIYNAAMGTTLQFDGGPAANPVTVGTPPQLNGPGQYQFTSGYLLLTENVIPNLPLTASGSVLELGPAFQQSGAITNLTLGGITLAAGSYQVNGTLTVTNNSTINGAISVNSGAALDDSGGMTLAATGSLTIQGGGSLNVTSGFNLAGPLTNVGTINMTNATLTINNNNTTTSGGIVNQGQINFYGASGDHISVVGYGYEYLVNQGTVNVLSGTGLSSITPYVGVLQGIYNAAMGTTLQFDGGPAANPVTVGTPPQLNGPGQYQFTSGYLLLTENVIPNLPLTASGSVLELGPAFQQSGAITNLTLGGITLAAGSYQVNGTLTVTNNSTINGAISVNSGAALDDSGGMTLAATGSLTIQGGGSLNVTSGFNLAGPLTNVGTINMTNATLTINNNNTTTSGGIVNQGQINFYGASGDHISVVGYGYEYLVNQGTVNVLSGTGLSSITPYVGVLQGIYNAAMGTTLQFDGGPAANPVTVGTPPQLNGPGQYQFTSGYLLLTENVIPNLPLTASGSVLELGPAFQQSGAITNLTLGGITLAAGSYQVNGTLTVTNNSTINGAISVNSGAALDDSGGMTLAATGSLTIQGGGSLNVTSGFNLAGPLTNVGTINMTNATLTINNNNTTTSGGIVNQGQINFYGASGDHISVVGYGYEYLINQGTISQRPGTGSSSINASIFTDPGTVDSQEGTLTLSSVSLLPSSVLNFGLNSPTDYGSIAVTASAVLGGTVSANLNNGFIPATGDVFKVLTYPSYSGIFAQTNLPSGTTGHGNYNPTFFTLSITGTSTPTNEPVLTIARVGADTVAVSWPIAAGNFNLQTSPDLSPGSWTDVTSGITTVGAGYVLNYTVNSEPAFFRLQSQ